MNSSVLVRSDGESRWRFFLNHSSDEAEIELIEPGHEALTGIDVEGSIRLGPHDVAILRSPVHSAGTLDQARTSHATG